MPLDKCVVCGKKYHSNHKCNERLIARIEGGRKGVPEVRETFRHFGTRLGEGFWNLNQEDQKQ